IDLWQKVRALSPDLVHECHQSGRTGKFFKLFSFFHGADYSFYNHHFGRSKDMGEWSGVKTPIIQKDLNGLYRYRGKGECPDYLSYPPRIELEQKPIREKAVILGVSSSAESKMWPLEYYVQLGQDLSKAGFKVKIPLSSSPKDLWIKERMKALGASRVEWIETSLERLPYEVAKATHYIGNDNGPKHLCAALGLKTLTLFGPIPPSEWHPYDREKHRYLYREPLACRTVKADFCALTKCDSMICLNRFGPKEVLEEFLRGVRW
ncbi:MAG: hypothetical protein OXB88_02555, partial [Bacteriovoracales bacterium]|nr:hypothetical protein [Bacteriovoracales bacterium]